MIVCIFKNCFTDLPVSLSATDISVGLFPIVSSVFVQFMNILLTLTVIYENDFYVGYVYLFSGLLEVT